MSKHIREKDLQDYGAGKLPPREFLRVQAHLENCAECQRRVDEMFPNISERYEALFLEEMQNDVLNDFHLNYDEHLKPYIYETIDAVDREIVESHVEICAECREDLRDLLQFHRELEQEKEIRELSKPHWWQNLTEWFSASSRKTVWLAFASILILIGAGLIWFFVSNSNNEVTQNQQNQPDTFELPVNETAPNLENSAAQTNQNADLPKTNQSKTVNREQDLPKKEIEMANLVIPKFLDELRINEDGTLRGKGELPTKKISVIEPNGTVIRSSSPVLRWENVPNAESYEVSIFDNDFNRITKIENIKGTSQRIANLARGKIYQWQVSAKTVTADGKTQNYLGQGKFYIVSQQDENKINQAKNSLERGRAFAEAGLLTEAANEFRTYLKENPDSENAKKFLRQVEQAQK